MAPAKGQHVTGACELCQVEHPVTEWISGVNIPSCQLMIGMGVPLHRLPDIRRLYGKDPWGTSTIDFENDPQIAPSGAECHPSLKGAIYSAIRLLVMWQNRGPWSKPADA